MAEIIPIKKLQALGQNLKKQHKKIVLVGGCFDILHPGHVIFLEKAKKAGDTLVVLLESDQKVRKLKGSNRPVHSQNMRALILTALRAVDYVVMLPFIESEADYVEVVQEVGPDVIAATSGDEVKHHKRVAQLSGAKLKYVTGKVGNYSSSRILAN